MLKSNEDNRECPLCMEPLELDDLNFFPCTCGYQICRFCWHRIRTNENGLCPACRKFYSEDPANFKPLTNEEFNKIKNEKRQKDLERKQKMSENRKHLSNLRVIQKNLVFVVGLPARLADPEELRKSQYFGKFGKIVKVIVNQNTSYAGSQSRSASAFVTYQKPEEALHAIQCVNNSKVDGKTLKASLGTTKYCSNFLKKLHCPKQDCMYLHELGYEAASFTKEEMQAGKHQEYERKLCEEIFMNSNGPNRKQITPVNHTEPAFLMKGSYSSAKSESGQQNSLQDSSGDLQSKQCTKDSAVRENTDLVFHNSSFDSQKQCCSSMLPRTSTEIHESSYSSSENKEKSQLCNDSSDCVTGTWGDSATVNPDHNTSSSLYHHGTVNNLSRQVNQQVFRNHEVSNQFDVPVQNSVNSVAKRYNNVDTLNSTFPSSHVENCMAGVNHTYPGKNVVQKQEGWLNSASCLLRSQMLKAGTDTFPVKSSLMTTQPENGTFNSSVLGNSFGSHHSLPTSVSINTSQNSMCSDVGNYSQKLIKETYPASENYFCIQEDDLGFDPWHESSKGLADLMIKEANEKARTACNFLPAHIPKSDSNSTYCDHNIPLHSHSLEHSRPFQQCQMVSQPGFFMKNNDVASMPSPVFGDAFPYKAVSVMNMHNQSTSALTIKYPPNLHHQNSAVFSDFSHLRGVESRLEVPYWKDSVSNSEHRNLGLNIIPVPNTHSSLHRERVPREVNSKLEEVLQQMKLDGQTSRPQNQVQYNGFSEYQGGSI